jgi:hypothetical protein
MVKRLGLWEVDGGGIENSMWPHNYYQDSLAGKIND